MANDRFLIVGLGNPGPKYADTRHNVGFDLIHVLADELDIEPVKARGEAYVGWGTYANVPLGLAMPVTYMNRSGRSVVRLLEIHDISLQHLLLVYDDINLELGAIRLRPSGSSGGHNGIQSVIDQLGTDEFPRLRLGIGNEFARNRQVEYVLSPFTSEQRPVIDETLRTAADACKTFVTDGLQTAMSRFNRRAG